MAIKVKCKCGKSFGAPDKYSGKRVKCPGCGDPLAIPASGQAAATEESAIKATCTCGKSISVKNSLAGKRIKCPGCSEPLTIPVPVASSPGATGERTGEQAQSTDTPFPDESSSELAVAAVGELLDEVDLSATNTGQRCPECRNDLGPDDILCIECGYRMDRGKKMETQKVVKPKGLSMTAGPSTGTSAPKAVQDLHNNLRILGYINLVLGIIGLVIWVAIFATGAIQADIPPELAGFAAALALIGGLISALSIWLLFFAAKKVMEGKSIGRILAIVISILYLPSFPIGTLIGVFLLVKALSADVAAHCSD